MSKDDRLEESLESLPELETAGLMVDEKGLPILELKCTDCDGRGRCRDCEGCSWYICFRCDGAGYHLTPFGRKVFDLLMHHARFLQSENE